MNNNKQEQQNSQGLSSILDHIPPSQFDPIVEILEAFQNSKDPDKINLTVGAYRNEDIQCVVFEAVKQAENEILTETFSREYLPFLGDEEFNNLTQTTIFDTRYPLIRENKKLNVIEDKRIATIHSISGSGSLRIGAEFLFKFMSKKIYVSNLTWPNHFPIFELAGFDVEKYPYYNDQSKSLDFENFINFLKNVEEGAIVLLHVCSHNPTGVDPSKSEWQEICKVMKEKNLFPFFDFAYQGYVTGDMIEDSFPIYEFLNNDFEMFIAQSFSKSMNLYGERAGSLHVIVNDPDCIPNIKSHFSQIVRSVYLVPIGHGARIIKRILAKENLRKKWEEELKICVNRMNFVRNRLYEELKRINVKGDWEHIKNQKGMFSYTGLNLKQCTELIEKHHVFLVKSGRISLTGLNEKNIPKVALAIKEVVENTD